MIIFFDEFVYIGHLKRWWKDLYQQPTMYEIGAFFLSHKMVVRRMKNKKRGDN